LKAKSKKLGRKVAKFKKTRRKVFMIKSLSREFFDPVLVALNLGSL
jgi:hypothetical protein